MTTQENLDRTTGFFNKHLETMPKARHLEYLNKKLRAIVQYAYKNSTAIKNKMDSVGLKPKDIQTIIDLEKKWVVDPSRFASQGRNTPFAGWRLQGKAYATIVRGEVVMKAGELLV